MFFIKNPQTTKSDKRTFGFNTEVTAPYSAELKLFEDDLLELTANVKYKPVRNDFQNNLTKDIKKIDESKEVIVEADKTGNLYKVNPDVYRKLLTENVTKEYKKDNEENVFKTNKEAAILVKNLNIEERVDAMQESNAYITIKDHKPGFPNKIDCRLINPAKSNCSNHFWLKYLLK